MKKLGRCLCECMDKVLPLAMLDEDDLKNVRFVLRNIIKQHEVELKKEACVNFMVYRGALSSQLYMRFVPAKHLKCYSDDDWAMRVLFKGKLEYAKSREVTFLKRGFRV